MTLSPTCWSDYCYTFISNSLCVELHDCLLFTSFYSRRAVTSASVLTNARATELIDLQIQILQEGSNE
jgi:hypothetical protein